MDCFLCEGQECFLATKQEVNIYCSLFPDLDGECVKPLHILISPKKHFESIHEMSEIEYTTFMSVVRKIEKFYLDRGYGSAVTELRLHPGPHTNHVHIHLIFSSTPIFPLKSRQKIKITEDVLSFLKKEIRLIF